MENVKKKHMMVVRRRRHQGKCHCGALLFEFDSKSDDMTAIDCNCSICLMKKNTHVIVPKSDFDILQGEDQITTYTFNTHLAKHMFCKICGVQAFYIPRSNPDGVAVTLACIEPSTLGKITVLKFNGADDWETSFNETKISSFSKK